MSRTAQRKPIIQADPRSMSDPGRASPPELPFVMLKLSSLNNWL
jgi:hypothetical protein